ncbi:unnamed protein product [Effrenium voratum]|uniref:EF-hand domain-containing protein n=1 Tax=Effrenium voratum TaxID=2562239 RepID=A0AA36MYG5_9DINO|nr:unnamed protein product [Effrenium voratum]CAJ1383283.1 unnamed protein product [Effrenium voratum]|mmetsp:Transcript_79816/g.191511  ORF Transcript_79816/g.191511 Transcript_79816/m.191511 type:complete len:685 (-) Transcript_79816:15-2069(-)
MADKRNKVDAKTLMDRKLNRHLEKLDMPTENVDIGNLESIESLLGNQMEEVYMQLQLHYATAIRLLAHRDAACRRYQKENESLLTQLDTLKTRDTKEKDMKSMRILNTQIKLYKDKYVERDATARSVEAENFELREQLAALQQVGNAYMQADNSLVGRPPAVHPVSPMNKPEMLYGSPPHAITASAPDPLDRLERAQQKLETWASQHRSTLKRDLTGLVDVSELPAMELPGEIATRGAYGPTPPTKAIDDEEKQEEEKVEEEEENEDAFYIRVAKSRVDDQDMTGPAYWVRRVRDMFKSWFFQGDRDMQDTYYSSGVCQYIARSQMFEHATMAMIAANAVWLGIDVTYNNQILLINSEPVFIIMENVFCTYFFLEIVVRFGAFRKKCNVFRDFWFVFDFALVLAMVVDTWALLIIMATLDTNVYVINSSFLRMLRIIRISRLARVARIMRSVPEVMILFQGMGVASRSVICALSLLVTLVYVFSLAFTQLLRDTPAGNAYFESLTQGMFSLFFHGCLGEQLPDMARAIFTEGIDVGLCLIIFVFLGPFTVMNMIVAVLVHVVSSVATLQQINQQNGVIRERVWGVLKQLDQDHDDIISQDEFRTILEMKDGLHIFMGVGVDVISIIKDPDIVFGGEQCLPIDEVVDEVIALRGSNFTTVKDLVQLKNQLVREMRRVGQRRVLAH